MHPGLRSFRRFLVLVRGEKAPDVDRVESARRASHHFQFRPAARRGAIGQRKRGTRRKDSGVQAVKTSGRRQDLETRRSPGRAGRHRRARAWCAALVGSWRAWAWQEVNLAVGIQPTLCELLTRLPPPMPGNGPKCRPAPCCDGAHDRGVGRSTFMSRTKGDRSSVAMGQIAKIGQARYRAESRTRPRARQGARRALGHVCVRILHRTLRSVPYW